FYLDNLIRIWPLIDPQFPGPLSCHEKKDLGLRRLSYHSYRHTPYIFKFVYTIVYNYSISIYPSVPFILILCPSLIIFLAFSTPTTAGKPYSRAITAP